MMKLRADSILVVFAVIQFRDFRHLTENIKISACLYFCVGVKLGL
jgi:hypothetical protein